MQYDQKDFSTLLDEVQAQELELAWIALSKSHHGQRVLHYLMGKSNVMASSFAVDPYITAFNAGKQALGLEIVRSLDALGPEVVPNLLLNVGGLYSADKAMATMAYDKLEQEQPEDE